MSSAIVVTSSGPGGGSPGPAGESSYQEWLDAGHTGTQAQFLASLVGPQGSSGIAVIGTTVSGATGNKLLVTDSNGDAQEGPVTTSVVTGTGSPTAGQIPVFTGTGNATAPGAPSGGSAPTKAQIDALGLAPADVGITGPGSVGAAPATAVLAGLPLAATVTASGGLTANTNVPVNATANSISLALPTTGTVGQVIYVEREDTVAANAVAVTGTVRGTAGASLALTLQYESIVFVYEGSGSWRPFAGHKTLSSMDARYTLPGATPGQLPSSVVSDSALIDIGRAWGNATTTFPAVTPGTDITTTLQAAYTYAASGAFPNGCTIRISKPGTYLLSGASQTGTYTNGTSNYSYAGQILVPALTMAQTMDICLEGATASTSGDSNTGGPNGVIIQSNVTSGYLFDCVPAFTRFAAMGVSGNPLCCWTGAIPKFRNLTFLVPDNPTCGGINAFATQRLQLERVSLQNPSFEGSGAVPTSGTLAGVVCPQVENNGDIVIRDSFIRGFPVGVSLSEHVRMQNTLIAGCLAATQCAGTSHENILDLDVEECPVVFSGAAYAGITGTPNTYAGTSIVGDVDFENVATGGLVQTAFVSDTRAGPVIGQIRLWNSNSKMLPTIGGTQLDIVLMTKPPTSGPLYRAGWMSTHPYDNFGRNPAGSGAGYPGLCSASAHPWRTDSGGFTVASAGQLAATVNPSYCFVPTKFGGVSRIISTTFQLATGGQILIIGESPVSSTGTATLGGVSAIVVKCVQNSAAILKFNNSNILGLNGGNLAASTAYTIDLEIIYGWQSNSGVLQAQYPVFARVYLNGTLIGQAALGVGAALGAAAPYTYPLYEDGLGFLDTSSYATLFRVRDASPDPRLKHLVTATGTHTAWHYETTVCTSGTFTVTLPAPVQDVPNTILNPGTGTITVAAPSGTLTSASGATGSLTLAAGAKAEITSPDGTNFQQTA
jgi:hypothetical protein